MGDQQGLFAAGLSRRSVLRGPAGIAALGVSSSLSGCAGGATQPSATGGTQATGAQSMTWGSNHSDPDSRATFASLMKAATAKTGVPIKIDNTDHETFQQNISNYLQGTPDDGFNWFAGYRIQFLAAQGLAAPIDDVWAQIGGHFDEAKHTLSKGVDGQYYFVPMHTYPWVVFHSKKVFADNGYEQPATWDELLALLKKMKTDGLVPIAFGNKATWPALGTFDILNFRINGHEYHTKLLAHEIPWTDPGVTAVFDHWAHLMPYVQAGANGRAWEDAVKTLENRKAGLLYQGTAQVGPAYTAANVDDLDFFVYPEINAEHARNYLDAPTDGLMLAGKAKNPDAGKKVLTWLGTPEAEQEYMKNEKWQVGAAKDVPDASYNELQKKSAEALRSAKAVTQYFDTDSDPAMGSAMTKLLQQFFNNPSKDTIASIQQSAESQAKSIFG